MNDTIISRGGRAPLSEETERLVFLDYTRTEKILIESYAEGHVVAFHRVYKRLGVGKGDELRSAGTDPKTGTVALEKAEQLDS